MLRRLVPRQRLMVEPKIQLMLLGRVVLYWFAGLVALLLMLLCWRVLTGPMQPFAAHWRDLCQFYGPGMIASLLLLPLVAVDVLRTSNRLVGPLGRLRQGMESLARGETTPPVVFRSTDLLQELAEDFNRLRSRVQG